MSRAKHDEELYRNVIRTRWGNAAEVVDTNRAKADVRANCGSADNRRADRDLSPPPHAASSPPSQPGKADGAVGPTQAINRFRILRADCVNARDQGLCAAASTGPIRVSWPLAVLAAIAKVLGR